MSGKVESGNWGLANAPAITRSFEEDRFPSIFPKGMTMAVNAKRSELSTNLGPDEAPSADELEAALRERQPPKASKPADPRLKHESVKVIKRIAREGTAVIKAMDPAKGASLSSEATVALLGVDADALRGRRIVECARHGHEVTHGTTEEKETRWAVYQNEVNKLCDAHPNWSWTEITHRAAKNRACCAKTIARRCHDPRKK